MPTLNFTEVIIVIQDKSKEPISGVNCMVSSCNYHTEDNECLAGRITVGQPHSEAKSETDCETFVKKG